MRDIEDCMKITNRLAKETLDVLKDDDGSTIDTNDTHI